MADRRTDRLQVVGPEGLRLSAIFQAVSTPPCPTPGRIPRHAEQWLGQDLPHRGIRR